MPEPTPALSFLEPEVTATGPSAPNFRAFSQRPPFGPEHPLDHTSLLTQSVDVSRLMAASSRRFIRIPHRPRPRPRPRPGPGPCSCLRPRPRLGGDNGILIPQNHPRTSNTDHLNELQLPTPRETPKEGSLNPVRSVNDHGTKNEA
jgi:hypothetical protein